jgi:hypothetical protein
VFRLEGQQFGELKVLKRDGFTRHGYVQWRCVCTCGQQVLVGGDTLRRGYKKACGINGHRFSASKAVIFSPATRPLGPSITARYKSEYQSWIDMKRRCFQPQNHNFHNYGARGITVDPRWMEFKNFMLDMGRKPDSKFTIERNDVNGNYEPSNCKWIDRKDQSRNKRNSVYVVYQGRKMLLIDLVEELGLSRDTVRYRLKSGWSMAQAIALPIHSTVNGGGKRGRPKGVKNKAKFPIAFCNTSS